MEIHMENKFYKILERDYLQIEHIIEYNLILYVKTDFTSELVVGLYSNMCVL